MSNKKFKNVSGQKFNRLTVIDRALNNKYGDSMLNCLCDCGKTIIVRSICVRNGSTKSCGCHTKKWTKLRKKKKRLDASLRSSSVKFNSGFNSLYLGYFHSSTNRNKDFNLNVEDFAALTKMNCHYCNRKPHQIRKSGADSYTYNGIDRTDNSKGYQTDNVVPCCKICNFAKHSMSKKEFELWIKDLVDFQISKRSLLVPNSPIGCYHE